MSEASSVSAIDSTRPRVALDLRQNDGDNLLERQIVGTDNAMTS